MFSFTARKPRIYIINNAKYINIAIIFTFIKLILHKIFLIPQQTSKLAFQFIPKRCFQE
jgi:hypothetical protein